jgi:hypothetical protein
VRSYSIFALVACVLCIAADASASTVVFSDNFAGDPLGLGVATLSNWTIVAGNVDVIGADGTNSSYDFYPGSGKYLDLDGTGPASPDTNATIQTVASFGPGIYNLTFDLGNNKCGGSTVNTLDVFLGSTRAGSLATTGFPALSHESFTFSSTGGELSFVQGGPADQQGSFLFNVQLATAAPEPGTFAVLGVGLAGLGMLRRRR